MSVSADTLAIEGRLKTMPNRPTTEWPNRRDFTPPDGIYLRVQHVRAPKVPNTVNGAHAHRYSLVVVVMGVQGDATRRVDEVADAVAAHFPAGLRVPVSNPGGALTVAADPHVPQGFQSEGRWQVPVTVSFERMG